MVVGKVSEFIGSLYYLCVTLLRFKNIMKLKNYLLLLALLLVVGVRAQVPSGNKYPKREFRGAWIQAVNGQFRGIPTERLKQILISQLNSLQEAPQITVKVTIEAEEKGQYTYKDKKLTFVIKATPVEVEGAPLENFSVTTFSFYIVKKYLIGYTFPPYFHYDGNYLQKEYACTQRAYSFFIPL